MSEEEKNDALREFNIENQLRINYEKKFGASKSLVEVSRVIHFVLQEGNAEIERLKDELLSYRRPIGTSVVNVREDAVKKRNAEVKQAIEKYLNELEIAKTCKNANIKEINAQQYALRYLLTNKLECVEDEGGETK